MKYIYLNINYINIYIKLDFDSLDLKTKNTDEPVLDEIKNNFIDIYIQQRNARKRIITIEGLNFDEETLKNYAKSFRKSLNCSCSVDKKDGLNILKLSSQNINDVKKFLIDKIKIEESTIRTHGNI